ncbi:MAG: chromosome segregation protein SMC [Desulfobacterales bacterium]
MRLKKMEITGFKSFSDRAVIQFPPGISAIVGPNGCGKSNIVDALRWAMGEQSVKQLRGKNREDIIFAGTEGRPPLNLAEVSLTLANDNGDAPEELKDFTEIMLTRRLYRSGETAYLINKQSCRLKDIHNIFMGSGMGAKSYAVIQQGNIGAITEAGPEERRLYIEEAAGITRYKSRKTETLQKLEATNQNLVRVQDIITEVERQMNSLKRQASKAERYKNLKERIRDLDVRLALHQSDQISQEIAQGLALLKELKDQDMSHESSLKKLDAAIEEIGLRRAEKNREISEQKSGKFDIQRRIDKSENDLEHLRKEIQRLAKEYTDLHDAGIRLEEKNREMLFEMEQGKVQTEALDAEIRTIRADLDREQQSSQNIRDHLLTLNRDLDESKNSLMDLVAQEAKYKNISQNVANNRDNLKRRLKRLDEDTALAGKKVTDIAKKETEAGEELHLCKREIRETEEQVAEIRKLLTEKNQALGKQVKLVQTLEYERNKVRSRYSALKKMADSFEWYRDGVKAVMKREHPEGHVLGLVADILEPETGYDAAVEAVLGEGLQYVIVKDPETGQEAIEFLQTQNAGRSGFVPVSVLANEEIHHPDLSEKLIDHVRVKSGFEKIAQILLGHVGVAENLAQAISLFRENGKGAAYVTRSGDLISSQGIMSGGSPDKLSGILGKKQELRELENRLTEMDAQLETGRQEQKDREAEVTSLESDLQHLTEKKNQAAYEEMEAQKNLYRISEELKHARRDLEVLRLEQEQLLAEADDMEAEMEKYNAALSKITDEVQAAQRRVAEISEQITTVSAQMGDFDRRVTDLRLKETSLKAELENSLNSLRRLRQFQEDGARRMEQLAKDTAEKERKKSEAEKKIREYEEALAILYGEMQRIQGLLQTSEADYDQIDAQLREKGKSISDLQGQREEILKKIRLLEVEQTQREMRRENIGTRISERWHRPLDAFREEMDQLAGADMNSADMESELESLRKKLDDMGSVNMGAIAEYQQMKERFDFLDAQRSDLLKAVDDLHKVIQKINRVSQERFMQTFHQINEKMAEVFPRLFNGGSAKLVLTEPNNALETGVEFMVHPPGKKLTRLSLLSGGEKALSAIAFVFSIFLIKPASFCIMDEIDAPLDEANVYRFNELLRIIGEKSQIIMITHKKKSMEFADTLFGITMEQKGVSKVVSVSFEGAAKTADSE